MNTWIIPSNSILIKEGELYKVGRNSSMMQQRYFVLRESTLFIYLDKNDKYPHNLIFLKGFSIKMLN